MVTHPTRPLAALFAVAIGLLGCKVNENDIEQWKGTIKGPAKMVAVMQSDKYPEALKVRAAMALVEMERSDVDGIDELSRGMLRLDTEKRAALITAMAEDLEQLMRGGSETQAAEGGPPTELQARAKDAVYALIDLAPAETKSRFIATLIAWYSADFNGRNLAGRTSAEQVVRKLGPPAAAKLVEGMSAKIPPAALIKLTQLVSETGVGPTRKSAAARIVAIQKEMESQAFMDWLKPRVKEGLQKAGRKTDEKSVQKAAEGTREIHLSGALTAMKPLASEEAVQTRLLEIAATPSKDAKDPMTQRRELALRALEGKASEKHLDVLLKLALDPNNPIPVRDTAFDRVGDIGSKRAIEPLLPLVGNGQDQRLRWRAGELVLSIGGADILGTFFSRLPGGATQYEPEELDGYATRMGDMTPAPRAVALERLRSPSWWERVIALRYLARKGTKADVPAMQALSGSKDAVAGKNWKNFDWKTVGDVAKESVKDAESRLGMKR
jgi:hypothetical protein